MAVAPLLTSPETCFPETVPPRSYLLSLPVRLAPGDTTVFIVVPLGLSPLESAGFSPLKAEAVPNKTGSFLHAESAEADVAPDYKES